MSKDFKLHMCCRITNNNTNDKTIEFIKEKLSMGYSKQDLLLNALNIYRKYENGSLLSDEIEELREIIEEFKHIKPENIEQKNSENEEEKPEEIKKASDIISSDLESIQNGDFI